MKLHKCQRFPDDEYWIEVSGGVWKVKPKKGYSLAVTIIIKELFGIPILKRC